MFLILIRELIEALKVIKMRRKKEGDVHFYGCQYQIAFVRLWLMGPEW